MGGRRTEEAVALAEGVVLAFLALVEGGFLLTAMMKDYNMYDYVTMKQTSEVEKKKKICIKMKYIISVQFVP
jgi:hypothetical protein